jgi:hypothetical protein
MTSTAAGPTLADMARQFPHWQCWHAASGMYLARHREAPPEPERDIRGYDLTDLRHQITRAETLGIRQ